MWRYVLNCTIVILTLLLLGSIACNVPPSRKAEYSMEVTDQSGRIVKLVKIPERIVSLAPGNTEVLYALGIEDKVVGVTDYCNYPPGVKNKPSMGGFSTPNLEKLASVSPDLVLATSMHQKMVVPRLEEMGVPAVILDPKTVDEILASINLVGSITGKENEASLIVEGMRTRISAVTDKTGNLLQEQKPRVLFITWFNPLMAAGSGTLQDELIQQAGGVNIAGGLTGHTSISLEEVVAANPEVIISGVGMGSGDDGPLQFARTEPRLSKTYAVLHNQVYAVDIDLAGRPGPRITDALQQFAEFIHPELFKAATR